MTYNPTATEPDVRQELIATFISEQDQPVVQSEIAFALGLNKGTISKDIHILLAEGKIFGRQETQEERKLRFGDTVRANPACLYFKTGPVPERTVRVAVEGFMAETTVPEHRFSSTEVTNRLGKVFAKKGRRFQFTSETLHEATGISVGTLHHRIRAMMEDGLIERAGNSKGKALYRVKNRESVLNHFGVPYELKTSVPEAAEPLPTPEVPVIHRAPVSDLVSKAQSLLQDIASLPDLIAEKESLEARVADLNTRIEKISQVAELLK